MLLHLTKATFGSPSQWKTLECKTWCQLHEKNDTLFTSPERTFGRMIRSRKELYTLSRNCSTAVPRSCVIEVRTAQAQQTRNKFDGLGGAAEFSHSIDAAFGRGWSQRARVRHLSVAQEDGVLDTAVNFLGAGIVCASAEYSFFRGSTVRVRVPSGDPCPETRG